MDKILRDKKAIFVFIAPALIMFLLVLIIPTIQMVYYSLCDYAALTPPEFVGLKNYKKLFFGDATFRIALKNSIFFMIFSAVPKSLRRVFFPDAVIFLLFFILSASFIL